MIGLVIAIIGFFMLISGRRFVNNFVQPFGFLLVFALVMNRLVELFGKQGGWLGMVYIVLALIAGFLTSAFARGLFIILLFWISTVLLYSVILKGFSPANDFLASLAALIITVPIIYVIFLSRLSFIFGIICTSILGTFLLIIGFEFNSGGNEGVASVLSRPTGAQIIIALCLLIIGALIQLYRYHISITPRPNRIYWGLERVDNDELLQDI